MKHSFCGHCVPGGELGYAHRWPGAPRGRGASFKVVFTAALPEGVPSA